MSEMMCKVFSGTANRPLYEDIIGHIGFRCRGNVKIDKFIDGEIFVQYDENIRGKDVFLVQSMSAPVNDSIMELLIMIDAAKRASADRVTAVIPFFAYARQDRKDKARVPISAKLLANMLVSSGTDRILTMDLHSQQIQGFFDIPVDHLEAYPVFCKQFRRMLSKELANDEVVILAPDSGSAKKASKYAESLGAGIAICSKQRHSGSITSTIGMVGSVKDKTVIMIDDLSTTGGTLFGAAEIAHAEGAKTIIAAITHNVTTSDGMSKLYNSPITNMLMTDTIDKNKKNKLSLSLDGWLKCLSVSELFSNAISCIHENDSVSHLLR